MFLINFRTAKINKKIYSGKPGIFEFNSDKDLKNLKMESVLLAKELYEQLCSRGYGEKGTQALIRYYTES